MKENQSSRSQQDTVKDLTRENERLKTNLNYYIEICTKLGEEVIHLQSILDTHINCKSNKDT
jgi:hypothetical protein